MHGVRAERTIRDMSEKGLRLDDQVVIPVLEQMRRVHRRLLELLDDLDDGDWARPTVHRDRDVKDLTAHLLHGSLRRITGLRDRYHRPMPAIGSTADLVDFIQADNRDFMIGMRRISPTILRELIARYDPEVIAIFEGLDPYGDGLGVAWAGQEVSPNWFDIAREYTEKWHHQQQLRDATGRPSLYQPELLEPVLETFARGLPFAFRDLALPEGSQIFLNITDEVDCGWQLRREAAAWTLWRVGGPGELPSGAGALVLSLAADAAWRMWTRGLAPGDAKARVQVVRGSGPPDAASSLASSTASGPWNNSAVNQAIDAVASFVAIMA